MFSESFSGKDSENGVAGLWGGKTKVRLNLPPKSKVQFGPYDSLGLRFPSQRPATLFSESFSGKDSENGVAGLWGGKTKVFIRLTVGWSLQVSPSLFKSLQVSPSLFKSLQASSSRCNVLGTFGSLWEALGEGLGLLAQNI